MTIACHSAPAAPRVVRGARADERDGDERTRQELRAKGRQAEALHVEAGQREDIEIEELEPALHSDKVGRQHDAKDVVQLRRDLVGQAIRWVVQSGQRKTLCNCVVIWWVRQPGG